MICKNCGAQAEGNFCNNCGAPLPKEAAGNNESMDAEYKVYNEEEAQKENQQKNVKVTIKEEVLQEIQEPPIQKESAAPL